MSLPALPSSRSSSARHGRRWAGRATVSTLAVAALAAPATPALAAGDTTPPAPVSGLVTTADKTRAKLDWTGNTEKDLAGYLVYRAATADGTYTKLTAAPVTSSEYSDYAAPAGMPSYYKITAVDTSNNESTPVSATVTRKDGVAPAAPKALTAARTDSGIRLSWAENSEADLAGYVVSRATTSGGTYTKLTTKPVTGSSYTDPTASSTANYYYKVTATDFSGNTSSAASIAVLLPDTTAPAPVRSMVVTASTTGIKLDWASNSESDLAGYLVYRATSSGGAYTKLTTTPRTSSDYTDTAAPVGVPAYYRVVAVDKSGNESTPVAASGTRKDGVAPAAPTSLTAKWSQTGVALSWAPNAETDLAGYVVSRATTSGGTYTKLTATPVAGSSYNDTTAPAGASAYYYKVSAVDTSGNTSSAASTSATPPDTSAPAAVRSMVVSADTSKVKLDWASNSESDLAGYLVYRSVKADGDYTRLTATPRTSSDYSDIAAPVGVLSYYRVTAIDKTGNESASVSASGLRKDGIAPAAPKSLTAKPSTTGVSLAWAPNTEADVVGYVVSRASTSGGTYTKLTTTPIATTSYVDPAAPNGATWYYKVSAVDTSGNTSSSASVNATVPDLEAPKAPTGLLATGGDTQISLVWTKNTETDVAGYNLYRWNADAPGAVTKVNAALLTGTEYTDRSVVNGAGYGYQLAAVDKAGNVSTYSDPTVAKAADITAPAAPAGVTATGVKTGVTVTWTQSTEADLAGYVVYRAGSADGVFTPIAQAAASATAFTDTGAPADATSFYRVTAVDKVGNESAPSATKSAAPADITPPAQPTALTATGTEQGVTLAWTGSNEPDISGYVVYRGATPDGTFTKLTGPLSGITTYADTDAPAGVVSYYRVTAVDTNGNASTAATASGTRVAVKVPVTGADLTVARDGSGDYTTVAAALNAAPSTSTKPFVIGIKPGTYREMITVDKPNVTLLGATSNASDVVLTYDNAAGTMKPGSTVTYGTSGSASVLIKSNNVTTKNLTIENAYKETGTGSEQAVALKTTGDRLVFDNVRLLGDQDTLYADSAAVGTVARSYYTNSYIEGDVDFIFGRGTAVFDHSTLKAATRGSTSNNGYVTAASTDKSLSYGFLITDSTITSDAPAASFHLGRPWQPSNDVNAIAQVVIRDSELPAAMKPAPWTDMSATFSWRNARFFEYKNTGAGAGVNADRPQLTDTQATKYTKFTYLADKDGWNPTGQTPPPPPADTVAPGAPAKPTATVGDSKADLTWTASTEEDVAGYNLYRSGTGTPSTDSAPVNGSTLLTATSYTDNKLANGTNYTYVLTAVDKAGNESPASAPVTATPVGVPLPAHDILVAADGSGQFTSLQAAITAASAGTAVKPTVIAIKPGTYKEMLTLSKNYVTLIGTTGNAKDVVLTYDNAAGTTNPATGAAYGTGASQSVLVKANNVTVRNLTIENSFDEAAYTYSAEQAVALKTTGDRLVFDNVRLLGNQDTLLVDSPNAYTVARSYFTHSYIEGDVDFIFGRGTAVFEESTIHALSRGSSSNNGYVTAASTSDKNPFGFLITDSTITSDAPVGTFSLGRPWRGWADGSVVNNGVTYNSRGQVTIRNTALPAAIRTTQPWAAMDPNLWTDGRFFEYGNTGAGASVNGNRPQLTDEQAASATKASYLAGSDNWNPSGS